MFRIFDSFEYWFGSVEGLFAFVSFIFAWFFALSFHEFCHGYVAYKLGDDTAKAQGRLTLNPFKHLDLWGTIAIIVANVGWARAVPVNPVRFTRKVTQKTGMVLVSLAGPLSNFILGFVTLFFYLLTLRLWRINSAPVIVLIQTMLMYLYYYNILFAVFNLLPIPPLDGYKVFSSFLPNRAYWGLMRYERYGFIILILLFNIPGIGTILGNAVEGVLAAYTWVFDAIGVI